MTKKELVVSKVFGLFFFGLTLVYFGFFLWTAYSGGETMRSDVFEEAERGSKVLIFAYICWAIHNDIRMKERYLRDAPLYEAVDKMVKGDPDVEQRYLDSLPTIEVDDEGGIGFR